MLLLHIQLMHTTLASQQVNWQISTTKFLVLFCNTDSWNAESEPTTKACTSTTYNGCLGLAVSWVTVLLHNLHLPSSNRDKRGLNEVLWRSRGHFKVIHSNILAGKEETLGSRNLLKGIWSTPPAVQCCGSQPSMHALQSFGILNSCSTLNGTNI